MNARDLLDHDQFLVLTVVPVVDAPRKRVQKMRKQEPEQFLHDYDRVAEEVVAIIPVTDDSVEELDSVVTIEADEQVRRREQRAGGGRP